jgi:hypothetical protein
MPNDHLFIELIVIDFVDHRLSYFYFAGGFFNLSLNVVDTVCNVLQSLVQREPIIEKSFTIQVVERPCWLMVIVSFVLIWFNLRNQSNLVHK